LGIACAKLGSSCGRAGDNFSSSTGHLRISPGSPHALWMESPGLNCEKNAFPHIHSAYYYDYRDIDRKPERQSCRAQSVENSRRRSEVQSLAVPLEWRRERGRSLCRLSSSTGLWKTFARRRTSPGRPPQSVEGGMMVADSVRASPRPRETQWHHQIQRPRAGPRGLRPRRGSATSGPDCQEADTR